jgi:hypothetical protein
MFRPCVLVMMVGAGPAISETITFQHNESVMIVRGRNAGGDAKYEFLANGEGRLQCIALDSKGHPIAVENTFRQMGWVRFADIDVVQIDRVFCRNN